MKLAAFSLLAAAGLLSLTAGFAEAEIIQIRLKGMTFNPGEVTAHTGDTIEWINDDTFAHTATARDGAFDISLKKGETRQYVVDASGEFAYYCRLHPNMKATLSVSSP